MKYQDPSFSSPANSDKYRDGWERTFGKKKPQKVQGKEKVVAPTEGAEEVPEEILEEACISATEPDEDDLNDSRDS